MFTKGDNTMQSKAPLRWAERESQGARPRRGLGSWIRRGLVWTIVGLLALAVIGAIYQAIATQMDQRTYSPPGEMVDVDGHLMHINCMGEGGPTVILEAANLGMSAHWVRVQQQLAQSTRVCAYDRAGLGWSERGPEPRDARQISSELHTLLKVADTEGPYVVVGHSYGGLYAQMYAARYSEEVAGVVLVDSSHPEQFTRSPEGRAMNEQTNRLGAVIPFLTRLGVIRLFNVLPAHPDLPQQQRARIEAFNSSTRHLSITVEEFRATPETNAQVRATGSLGDKPLAVITAGANRVPDWLEMQDELAALSSDSIHRVVDGATHVSLLYDKRDAQVTSAGIQQVVEAVRTDRPLTR
jgi:pimeloyl-ACP methyl ester carboxylesterase